MDTLFLLLLFSCQAVSSSFQHHAVRHAGLPCPSLSPGIAQTHVLEAVTPSNHCPLLFLPSIFPSIRIFSNESAFQIRWPKYWSFSFSISQSFQCIYGCSISNEFPFQYRFLFISLRTRVIPFSSPLYQVHNPVPSTKETFSHVCWVHELCALNVQRICRKRVERSVILWVEPVKFYKGWRVVVSHGMNFLSCC